MLDLEQVQHDIDCWITNFVEVPHPALGGWAPCPYARKARLDKDFEVQIGSDPYVDLKTISQTGINKSVVIIAYDSTSYTADQFQTKIESANLDFLIRNNLLALEDHPGLPEIVNGISMNQGTYALALVQSLSDLNDKAKLIAKKDFYKSWPDNYLQILFSHREDPRK